MLACAALCVLWRISECVTVHRLSFEPDTKNIEELSPLVITCKLDDILTITVPIRSEPGTLYYLRNPSSDVTQLNITPRHGAENYEESDLRNKFKVNNVNSGKKVNDKTVDIFSEGNDFVIGPLLEEDHGNWVLSVYKKLNGEWVEWFQVITIEIIDTVPMKPSLPELDLGSTLELSFAYPIKTLQSCQLIAPASAFDRFYERTPGDACNYIVRNVTAADGGVWMIMGVGRIVYMAETTLKVNGVT